MDKLILKKCLLFWYKKYRIKMIFIYLKNYFKQLERNKRKFN